MFVDEKAMAENFMIKVANTGELLALLGNYVNLQASLCIASTSKRVNLACSSNTKF
jgi:hypothetical protein